MNDGGDVFNTRCLPISVFREWVTEGKSTNPKHEPKGARKEETRYLYVLLSMHVKSAEFRL